MTISIVYMAPPFVSLESLPISRLHTMPRGLERRQSLLQRLHRREEVAFFADAFQDLRSGEDQFFRMAGLGRAFDFLPGQRGGDRRRALRAQRISRHGRLVLGVLAPIHQDLSLSQFFAHVRYDRLGTLL